MLARYHEAIVENQYAALLARVERDEWTNVHAERSGPLIFVSVEVWDRGHYTYLTRIDTRAYPVDPYWIGFLNPNLPRQEWTVASDSDPRFWPWSPMPGLHGSFIVAYQGAGPYRTFWCRECTVPYFYYHGDQRWRPREWPVDRVVAHLREALRQAEPPTRWRPLQVPVIQQAGANVGVQIPADGGSGAR